MCDCPDSTYRKAQCKHALMVAAQVADCEALKILNGDGSDMEQRLQELLEQYRQEVATALTLIENARAAAQGDVMA